MKKITAIVAGLMLIPFTAFGMQTISEQEMDNVTGQSGVAIAINDLMIYNHDGGQELWYETQAPGADNSAAVGLVWDDDSYSMMHVNAIMYDADTEELYSPGRDLQGTYVEDFDYNNTGGEVDGTYMEDILFTSSALTITVTDDVAIIGEALDNANALIGNTDARGVDVTGITIGLPTVELFTESDSWDVITIAATQQNPTDADLGDTDVYSFGTIYTTDGDSTMAVLDGSVEIVPLENYTAAQADVTAGD